MPNAVGNIKIDCNGREPGAAPIGGGNVSAFRRVVHFGNGSSDSEIQDVYAAEFSIAGGDTQAVNLRALVDVSGNTVSLTKIAFIAIEAPEENPDSVTVEPSAVNGWDSFLTDVADIPPGTGIVGFNTLATEWLTDATHYGLTFTNTDPSVAAIVRLFVWGV